MKVDMTSAGQVAVRTGRVNRRREIENEEVQIYLSRLKDLVPFMPKNRKISKLEVIRNVIEYICDLQCILERKSDNACNSTTRQPLGTLATTPNSIQPSPLSPTAATPIATSSSPPPTILLEDLEKSQEEFSTAPATC